MNYCIANNIHNVNNTSLINIDFICNYDYDYDYDYGYDYGYFNILFNILFIFLKFFLISGFSLSFVIIFISRMYHNMILYNMILLESNFLN